MDKDMNLEGSQRIGSKIYTVGLLIIEIVWLLIRILISIGESVYRNIRGAPLKEIKGEIVLITGAGHGIGKELSLQLAKLNPIIVCWDINGASNDKTVEELKRLGIKAYGFVCDVANRQEVLKVAKEVQSKVGDVTILINNAGIARIGRLLDHREEDITSIFNINVLGHFWMLEAFLPSMIEKNHGQIVAMSSLAGHLGADNIVPYCASKHAVRGLMDALRVELRAMNPSSRIKLTTICPYLVDTGLCKNPIIRFSNVCKMLKTEQAVTHMILALLQETPEISIPGYALTISILIRFLPEKANQYLYDFLGIAASPEDTLVPDKK